MRGAGTDEETLIDILLSRTNAELNKIKDETKHYKETWKKIVSARQVDIQTTFGINVSGQPRRVDNSGYRQKQRRIQDFSGWRKEMGYQTNSRFNVILARVVLLSSKLLLMSM